MSRLCAVRRTGPFSRACRLGTCARAEPQCACACAGRVLLVRGGNNLAPNHNASRTTPLAGQCLHLDDFEQLTRHIQRYTLPIRDCWPYQSNWDRWPCHVTLAEKKACFFFKGFNAVTRFTIYILGHKVDLTRNVTLSRYRIWVIKLIY